MNAPELARSLALRPSSGSSAQSSENRVRDLRAGGFRFGAGCHMKSAAVDPIDRRVLSDRGRQTLARQQAGQLALDRRGDAMARAGGKTVQNELLDPQLDRRRRAAAARRSL